MRGNLINITDAHCQRYLAVRSLTVTVSLQFDISRLAETQRKKTNRTCQFGSNQMARVKR